jgi:hypothetical protein
MATTTKPENAPTRKQLAFLRALAQRTGTTFSYPRTRRQASRQIAQLLARPISTQLELDLDAVAVHGGELPERTA